MMSQEGTRQTMVTVSITPEILRRLQKAEIITAWDIQNFDRGKGWLAQLHSYTFKREITIEGPCAFYGGPYGPNAWTAEGGLCSMGAVSYSHSPLPEGMTVGRYCSIGRGLRFLDFAHPTKWLSSSVAFFQPIKVNSTSALACLCDRFIEAQGSDFRRQEFDPKLAKEYPQLAHDVWIGENVSLAMGISIGTGAVVASGSIVTKDVPPYAIVAGVPATVKKYRFDESLVKPLLESKWWLYNFADFEGMNITKPSLFVAQLLDKIAASEISEWKPQVLKLPTDLYS